MGDFCGANALAWTVFVAVAFSQALTYAIYMVYQSGCPEKHNQQNRQRDIQRFFHEELVYVNMEVKFLQSAIYKLEAQESQRCSSGSDLKALELEKPTVEVPVCSSRAGEEGWLSIGKRAIFLYLFLLFRPPGDQTMATHLGEDNLFYQSTDLNAGVFWRHLHRHTRH